MKSICIFPHFYDLPEIPYYVRIYVKELALYFNEILIVTNERELVNLSEVETKQIKVLKVNNKGYDLGKFYFGLQSIDTKGYSKIACINDSNILFSSLEPIFKWATNNHLDFWGLVDWDTKPDFSTHSNNYHIQSHFLVFEQKTIPYLLEYLNILEMDKIFNETDIKTLKYKVINDWEIGLSQYLITKKLEIKGYISHGTYVQKETKDQFYIWAISQGLPLIKKKIITSFKPRDVFTKNNWRALIKKNYNLKLDYKFLKSELLGIRLRHALKVIK